MKTRCFASYGAIVATTLLLAAVVAACEPSGVSSGIATPDWSAAVDWTQAASTTAQH